MNLIIGNTRCEMMLESVRNLLRDSLQLGERADTLTQDSQLLGAIPELDSMAVVTILTLFEEEFGAEVPDDEVSADVFATLGTLTAFLTRITDSQ